MFQVGRFTSSFRFLNSSDLLIDAIASLTFEGTIVCTRAASFYIFALSLTI